MKSLSRPLYFCLGKPKILEKLARPFYFCLGKPKILEKLARPFYFILENLYFLREQHEYHSTFILENLPTDKVEWS